MKSIQLGGVLVKETVNLPKLTGPARYRGTKVDQTTLLFGQVGWHREPKRSSSQTDEGAFCLFY
ncbi:hypothetical protein GC093_05395 [Paenibacillus sp. LMG 31456]|uniref:Uncharacterized protein n=1 Tax=Paenibacillus foliorum TaxID=2654974 RepID=A0A972K0A1_9BACL|nr:hypothetical protein [Paenibacillus foliorum]NOU92663.1 hypothetical protein [Paenibacillus foliorum]